jgi:putative PIN family toxin of toxin-antitoxin system
MWYHF